MPIVRKDGLSRAQRSYESIQDPRYLIYFICDQFEATGYDSEVIERGADECLAQIVKKSFWRGMFGTRQCMNVRAARVAGGTFVEISAGRWRDKIGSVAAGLFITWPALGVVAWSSFKERQARERAWALVEHYMKSPEAQAARPTQILPTTQG